MSALELPAYDTLDNLVDTDALKLRDVAWDLVREIKRLHAQQPEPASTPSGLLRMHEWMRGGPAQPAESPVEQSDTRNHAEAPNGGQADVGAAERAGSADASNLTVAGVIAAELRRRARLKIEAAPEGHAEAFAAAIAEHFHAVPKQPVPDNWTARTGAMEAALDVFLAARDHALTLGASDRPAARSGLHAAFPEPPDIRAAAQLVLDGVLDMAVCARAAWLNATQDWRPEDEPRVEELAPAIASDTAELARLREENEQLNAVIGLGYDRAREATERWKAEAPDERKNVLFADAGTLLAWLMAEVDKARTAGLSEAVDLLAVERKTEEAENIEGLFAADRILRAHLAALTATISQETPDA